MLSTTLSWTPLNAEKAADKITEDLKLTQEESTKEIYSEKYMITTTYRGGEKILEKVTPPDGSWVQTLYYIYLNRYKVMTYKVGRMGSTFKGAGMSRKLIEPEYTITMDGDKEGRIQRIAIFSSNYRTTYNGFQLKDGELIPWSGAELAKWRKMRSEAPHKPE